MFSRQLCDEQIIFVQEVFKLNFFTKKQNKTGDLRWEGRGYLLAYAHILFMPKRESAAASQHTNEGVYLALIKFSFSME